MGKKILITDDDGNVLKLLTIGLKKAGYDILTANNGMDGFLVAIKEKPDLIISDVVMPEMDGIELCRKIREESAIPMVPFIFMSSLDDPTNEIRGFRAGADEYLVKPVDRNVLLQKVHILLDRQDKNIPIKAKAEEDKAAFSGHLENLSIGEIIQLLNLNRRNGTLNITGPDGGSGKICMNNGQMTYSSYKKLLGEEAVYQIVRIQQGTFEFLSDEMEKETNIHGSTMTVLMEGLRLMDEGSEH